MVTRGPNPFGAAEHSRHNQDEWHRRAGDTRLPKWLRVAALAYGSHGNNGHASFKRGDVAIALGEPGAPVGRRRLHEHIQQAIDFGWLAEGSTSMCLIVPPYAIDKGAIGEPKKPCRTHSRRRGRQESLSGSHPDSLLKASGSHLDTSHQASGSHPDASRSGPISSLQSPHQTPESAPR